MGIERPEKSVYYSIEANDELIAGVCSRFHITPDSQAFRDALEAVLNADEDTRVEGQPFISIGVIQEVEALFEITSVYS
jgi:hypothetical protein